MAGPGGGSRAGRGDGSILFPSSRLVGGQAADRGDGVGVRPGHAPHRRRRRHLRRAALRDAQGHSLAASHRGGGRAVCHADPGRQTDRGAAGRAQRVVPPVDGALGGRRVAPGGRRVGRRRRSAERADRRGSERARRRISRRAVSQHPDGRDGHRSRPAAVGLRLARRVGGRRPGQRKRARAARQGFMASSDREAGERLALGVGAGPGRSPSDQLRRHAARRQRSPTGPPLGAPLAGFLGPAPARGGLCLPLQVEVARGPGGGPVSDHGQGNGRPGEPLGGTRVLSAAGTGQHRADRRRVGPPGEPAVAGGILRRKQQVDRERLQALGKTPRAQGNRVRKPANGRRGDASSGGVRLLEAPHAQLPEDH